MKEEGVGSLWNGTKPSIVLATNPAIHFMVYEAIKRYFQHYLRKDVSAAVLIFTMNHYTPTHKLLGGILVSAGGRYAAVESSICPDRARKAVIYPLKTGIYALVGISERTFTQ